MTTRSHRPPGTTPTPDTVLDRRLRAWPLLLALCAFAWLAGCGAETDESFTCLPGERGCECLENDGCASSDLLCVLGTCVAPACTPGEAGCTCFSNATCGQAASGEWLWCDDGICRDAACPPGELGCGCTFDGTCNSGLLCSDAGGPPRCELPSCQPGDPGCGCRRDRTCAPGPNGEEFLCDGGRCAPPRCAPGSDGCVCRADYSCDGALRCNETNRCGPPSCAAGSVGCGCRADGTCTGDDLFCSDTGRCEVRSCDQGTDGCGCFPDFSCRTAPGQQPLVCDAGRCRPRSCQPGQTGCGCRTDGTCASPSATCFEGVCVGTDCQPGDLNCPCLAGGRCNVGGVCENGLLCVDNTGFAGGLCFENQTCRRGNRCDGDLGRCIPCSIGNAGCACFDNGSCNGGNTCVAGTCFDSEALRPRPPADPICWTPCQRSAATADGNFRTCSSEGLMRGCIDDQTCSNGSCVAAGASAPTCSSDAECPDWQLCIDGGCYATCNGTNECSIGQTCWRKVCRFPCQTTGSSCPDGMFCNATDGTNGYCLGVANADGANETPLDATFLVDETSLTFGSSRPARTFRLTNTGSVPARFDIRKVEESTTLPDGSVRTIRHRDPATACDPGTDCPLVWLEIGRVTDATRVPSYAVTLAPGEEILLTVRGADQTSNARWQGAIEVVSPGGARQRIALNYAAELDGQWRGKVYYFANFETENLERWARGEVPASEVPNAFIAGWDNFRRGRVSLAELQAMLMSVRTESWRSGATRQFCQRATGEAQAVCFPFANADGVGVFTLNDRAQRMPSGISELSIAMNLRRATRTCPSGPRGTAPACFEGRIESAQSMHLPNLPQVLVGFANDPATCGITGASGCLTEIRSFSTDVAVGGRYLAPVGSCQGSRFVRTSVPWLVQEFFGSSAPDGANRRQLVECRDGLLPLTGAGSAERNAALAASNPIPDGRSNVRSIRIIDGLLVEQETMVLLFEERTRSFLDPSRTFAAYGIMSLSLRPDVLTSEDFVGTVQVDPAPAPPRVTGGVCPSSMLGRMRAPALASGRAAWANHVARAALDGTTVDLASLQPVGADEQVHVLCEETGLFSGGRENSQLAGPPRVCSDTCGTAGDGICQDGGAGASGGACALGTDCTDCGPRFEGDGAGVRVPCPEGSPVTYFTVDPTSLSAQAVAQHPCQLDGSCAQTLRNWVANGQHRVRLNPIWSCADIPTPTGPIRREVCDDDPRDPRWGRIFYSAAEANVLFPPLESAVADAFRYRFNFQSSRDTSVGFVPRVCGATSGRDSFCFDPEAIEEIRQRVDCLVDVYVNHADVLQSDVESSVLVYLTRNFSYFDVPRPGRLPPRTYDGYERLVSELQIMLGDQSLTDAYQSRFDLAQTNIRSFEGSRFEPDGIDISGQVGFEMVKLYEATQYYELVVDRFFGLSQALARSLSENTRDFITSETVTSWFDRIMRASTQKARANAEIARRYQSLNRADLARRVIERAYTRTYLESVVIAETIGLVLDRATPQQQDQIRATLELAQRRYRVELLQMEEVYRAIGNNINYFGFENDYIPFPALSSGDDNAFLVSLDRAWTRLALAEERENEALASDRSYNVDAASFEAELTRLRRSYEERLGAICGTFRARVDGIERVYPAIPRYAGLDPRLQGYGNPCGVVGNGELWEAVIGVELQELEIRRVLTDYENLLTEINLEVERIESQCRLIFDRAQFVYEQAGRVRSLQTTINGLNQGIGALNRALSSVGTVSGLIKCTAGLSNSCPMAAAAIGVYITGAVIAEIGIQTLDTLITVKQAEIADIERSTARYVAQTECDALQIDGAARLQSLALGIAVADLDGLRAQKELSLAASQIERLDNEATRLIQEWEEAQQLLIDVAAAQNDPNIRVYRDSAVVNADDTFFRALREAYRATKVYEYYTSQTYARQDQLYFVRMVNYGDFTLTGYLLDLEDAWREFEEQFGRPDTRVAILSLRDDILRIPRMDERGQPIAHGDRVEALRDRMQDPWLFDRDGYLNVPFNTRLNQLSPLTRNHKILFIEAEIIGSDVGDPVGRVYLRQAGTSAVARLDGDTDYYIFPERTAVLEAFFNGTRVFDGDVYRNERFRDRPFVNTRWEFLLNRRDELVNQDINVRSLTDIRFYVYYTDFTRL